MQIFKNLTYVNNNRYLRHTRERIITYVETITSQMLQRIWQGTENRLDILKANNGEKVEIS